MQDIFHIIILSITQGILEFFPVSSSAHLNIVNQILKIHHFKEIKIFLEFATFFTILIYFSPFIFKQLIGALKKQKLSINFFLKVIVATLPIVVAFPFLHSKFNNITLFLLLGSILLLIAEYKSQNNNTEVLDITFKQAFYIGIFQIFSLFSGFSRSGSTIAGGLLLGLPKKTAIKFSFLISLPLTFCSLIYKLHQTQITSISTNLIAFFICFIISLCLIKICFKVLLKCKLYYFAGYRILLAMLLMLLI